MNSLFLGVLTLVLAQGLAGRDNVVAKFLASIFVGAAATAFLYSLR